MRGFCLIASAVLLAGVSAVEGCSLTLDDSVVAVPLVGDPLPPTAFPKLNTLPATDTYVRTGADGGSWALLYEAPDDLSSAAAMATAMLGRDRVHMVRLDVDGPEEVIEATHITLGLSLLVLVEPSTDGTSPTSLQLRRPGDNGIGTQMAMPPGDAYVLVSGDDAAFVYQPLKKTDTPSYLIVRTDGSFQRQITLPPIPNDLNVQNKGGYLGFDKTSDLVINQQYDGHLIVHSTRMEQDQDLGPQDKVLAYLKSGAMLSCGMTGLKRIPLSGMPASVIDSTACVALLALSADGLIVYQRGDGFFSASEMGGPVTIAGATSAQQILGLRLNDNQLQVIYSHDSPLTYGDGIGDGWLADWGFMQRGKRPSISLDGARVRWMENAARSDGTGDLMSNQIGASSDSALTLALNVRKYAEVVDGQILCVSNATGKGIYNRLILIDEAAHQAHWVVDGGRDWLLFANNREALVKVVNGDLGYDIRRVPVPLR